MNIDKPITKLHTRLLLWLSQLLTPDAPLVCVTPVVDPVLGDPDPEPAVADDGPPPLAVPTPPLPLLLPLLSVSVGLAGPEAEVALPSVTPAFFNPQAPLKVLRSFTLRSAAGVDPQFAAWVIHIALLSRSNTAILNH